jgi:hypothetical protein
MIGKLSVLGMSLLSALEGEEGGGGFGVGIEVGCAAGTPGLPRARFSPEILPFCRSLFPVCGGFFHPFCAVQRP